MTELAIQRTAADGGAIGGVRFAGKSLDDLLADIAAGIAAEVRRDLTVAVVARDRHGSWRSGHAGCPTSRLTGPIVEASALPHHRAVERVVESALDDARTTHTARLIGVPIQTDDRVVGAVVVDATGTRSLDATDWSQAQRVAVRWALTLDNALSFASISDRASNLEIALAGRAVIEQAKGILMERERCDADQAFGILRELSQRGDVKLAAVAAWIVEQAQD